MLHWRVEGEELREGFNFYRPSDPYSAGFVLKAGIKRGVCARLRWSKVRRRLHADIEFRDFERDQKRLDHFFGRA